MGGIGDGVRERPGDLRRVHARAPGKINVFFEVGDVQPDGYHDVASVYQAVSLYEDVWASRADSDAITVDGDVDAGRDLNGVLTDTRHCLLPLPHQT